MSRCPRLACALGLLAVCATSFAAGPPPLPVTMPPAVEEKREAVLPPIIGSTRLTTVPSALSRFKAKIDARTPAKDLLPTAPTAKGKHFAPVYLGDDLTRVPEIVLEAPPAKQFSTEQWTERITRSLARADHLNDRHTDGYVKALMKERRDLAGLPFLLGGACRMKTGRKAPFQSAAMAFRTLAHRDHVTMVSAFDVAMLVKTKEDLPRSSAQREHTIQARMAVMSQVMWAEPADIRIGAVKYLSSVARVEATRELARIAVFSTHKGVREAAIEALSVRRDCDYTEMLVKALRYPWPSVAGNAAQAIVQLKRKDLIPHLIDVLDEPDPREPKTETIAARKVTVTHELVRINHHKSCLLCHAPVDPDKVGRDDFIAEVPVPSERLPSPQDGYTQGNTGLLVRIDRTYLRQDFSVMQAVEDAKPWPEMQRFDYLVRKRVLSRTAAKQLSARLNKREEGELSPYHRIAVGALRELTGRDVEAKALAWRKLLRLPAKRDG